MDASTVGRSQTWRQMTLWNTDSVTGSAGSQDGRKHSGSQASRTVQESGQRHFHVNPFRVPGNAMVTEETLRQRFAESSYWEDSPEISVLICGKDGSVLTVHVSGDVNIARLPVNRRVHAERVSDSGFAWCVETYDVVLDGDQIDVVECMDITFSELELSLS